MVNGFGFCCCDESDNPDPCGFVEADYVDPSTIALNWSDSLTVQTQDADPIVGPCYPNGAPIGGVPSPFSDQRGTRFERDSTGSALLFNLFIDINSTLFENIALRENVLYGFNLNESRSIDFGINGELSSSRFNLGVLVSNPSGPISESHQIVNDITSRRRFTNATQILCPPPIQNLSFTQDVGGEYVEDFEFFNGNSFVEQTTDPGVVSGMTIIRQGSVHTINVPGQPSRSFDSCRINIRIAYRFEVFTQSTNTTHDDEPRRSLGNTVSASTSGLLELVELGPFP